MKLIAYHSADEVLVVLPGDQNQNEQTMVRSLFKSPHEDTPANASFSPTEGFVGDRDPEEYERGEVNTGGDNFLIVSMRSSFSFS